MGAAETSTRSHRPQWEQPLAAIYARVSTDKQRDEATIESQVDEITQRVDSDGCRLLPEHVYVDDGYTGELLARPALDRMRDAARQDLFSVVYVYDRGRVSRRFAYQEVIIEELRDRGISFVSLHDIAAETAEDRVMQAMQGVFHEYERVKITERFRRGKLFKVRQGEVLGYVARYGYTYVPRNGGTPGHFVINEPQAAVVRQIFHWVADDHLSLRKVVRRLYELGIPPRRARSGAWASSTLTQLMRDEIYIGKHYYNKTEATVPRNRAAAYRRIKKTCIRQRPREEWIEIPAPPLLSEALFYRAQEQLRRNAELSPRRAKRPYLCQGMIYCRCGARLAGMSNNGRTFYRCSARQKLFPRKPDCRFTSVRAELVDSLTWIAIMDFVRDPARLRAEAARWLNEEQDRTAQHSTHRHSEATKRALQQALDEETRYARAYGEGAMSLELFRDLASATQRRRQELERELAQTQAKGSAGPSWTVEQLTEALTAYLERIDFAERKSVLQTLRIRVTADQKELVISGQLSIPEPENLNQRSPNRYTMSANDRLSRAKALGKFDLQVGLPPRDLGKKGYSPSFISALIEGANQGLLRPGSPL